MFSIEYWGARYGDMEWIETGYQGIPTREEADRQSALHFPYDKTRIVEYTTTSRVVSEQPAKEGT